MKLTPPGRDMNLWTVVWVVLGCADLYSGFLSSSFLTILISLVQIVGGVGMWVGFPSAKWLLIVLFCRNLIGRIDQLIFSPIQLSIVSVSATLFTAFLAVRFIVWLPPGTSANRGWRKALFSESRLALWLKPNLDMIFSRYCRVALLIVPYGMILIVGHGAAPLGLCLLLGGFEDSSINWLGWIGFILALAAPLIPRRDSHTVAVTIAACFLIASAMILASHFAHLASGGVPDGSLILFYSFAAFFLLREWYLSFVYHTKA